MHWDNVFGNVDYLLDYVIRQVHLKFICVFSALESILHLWILRRFWNLSRL